MRINRVFLAALIAGTADISVGVSYLLGIGVIEWYLGTLLIKVFSAVVLRAPGAGTLAKRPIALTGLLLPLFLSCVFNNAPAASYAVAAGFSLHLLATLCLTSATECRVYFRSAAIAGGVLASIYLLCAIAGQIEQSFGRYLYFRGSHPNLGSEIFAATTVMALISTRRTLFYFIAATCLIATYLMQGRAGMLVILSCVALHFIMRTEWRRRIIAVLTITIASLTVVGLFLAYSKSGLSGWIGSVFLVDDPYRGASSGFVGREDRWDAALQKFFASPIVGQGFNFYGISKQDGAHNFYLYALAELGLMSTLLFFSLSYLCVKTYRLDSHALLSLSPVLALTVFNDRFINLNPYPFLPIVSLVLLSVKHKVLFKFIERSAPNNGSDRY